MKRDIDRLMAERGIDWIVVEGPDGFSTANPDYMYLTGGVDLTGTVLKRRGEPATLKGENQNAAGKRDQGSVNPYRIDQTEKAARRGIRQVMNKDIGRVIRPGVGHILMANEILFDRRRIHICRR